MSKRSDLSSAANLGIAINLKPRHRYTCDYLGQTKTTCFIKIRVLRRDFSKNIYFIRSKKQDLGTIKYRRKSKFTFAESAKNYENQDSGNDRIPFFINVIKNLLTTITFLNLVLNITDIFYCWQRNN